MARLRVVPADARYKTGLPDDLRTSGVFGADTGARSGDFVGRSAQVTDFPGPEMAPLPSAESKLHNAHPEEQTNTSNSDPSRSEPMFAQRGHEPASSCRPIHARLFPGEE